MVVAGLLGHGARHSPRCGTSPRASRSRSPRTRSAPARPSTAADFRQHARQMQQRLLATLVRSTRRRAAARSASRRSTIASGELVIRRDAATRAPRKAGLRAMSIPIDPSRAVGGRLAAGDRIDVLFAGDREVSIIVRDAEVIAVDAKGRGGIGETSSPFTVTIAVDARAVAAARGRDRRRRHLARPHHGCAVVAGHRAAATRPGRRACRRRRRRRAWNPRSRWSSRPSPGSKELHRHLADHGGARVRQIVLEPALALEEEYDTLVVSDRWPALTRRSSTRCTTASAVCSACSIPTSPRAGTTSPRSASTARFARDAAVSEFVEGARRRSTPGSA